MSDLAKIEARIAALEAELARLKIARDVLFEMAASPTSPPKKANGAAITIRRVSAPVVAGEPPGEPAASKQALAPDKAKVRKKILAEIASGPVVSSALCKKFRLTTKAEKQMVYQMIYEMKTAGQIEPVGHGAYRAVSTPPGAAAAAADASAATH